MKTSDQEDFRRIIDAELNHVHTSDRQRQMLYENAKGEKFVKKKISVGLVLALALTLTVCVALAATGAFDALKSLWEDSFSRMNTTGEFNAVDEPEVSDYLTQFEAEYGGTKEDLILSTVPGEDDLPLEDAVRIAKEAIMAKFGTPQEELDAMGIYPEYVETPYQDELSQWRVYITPRTDVNLDDDHDYPAPGEYNVFIDSPSGEVVDCFYYNDDFWSEYALRCWENGSKDYVVEEAKKVGFSKLSLEEQQKFLALFAEAGYDVSGIGSNQADEEKLASLWNELSYGEPSGNLMDSGDAFVETALREMESRYGLTKEDLQKCRFIAIRSPLASETVDICFSYNFNLEENAGFGPCQVLGASYAKYLGRYMIVMDAETGKVLRAARILFKANIPEGKGDGLLSKRDWTKDDLPEYDQLMDELSALDAGYVVGRDSLNALLNEADKVMLAHGGDPEVYTASRPDDSDVFTTDKFLYMHNLTEAQIIEKGTEYLLDHTAYTQAELDNAVFMLGTAYDDIDNPDIEKNHPKLHVVLETEDGRCMDIVIEFDLQLNVTKYEETEGEPNG